VRSEFSCKLHLAISCGLALSNRALNRTRNGMPRLAVITFSAGRFTPLRAG